MYLLMKILLFIIILVKVNLQRQFHSVTLNHEICQSYLVLSSKGHCYTVR
jgi:hypothetical protein